MSFNEQEKDYLHAQRMARFATVSGDGQPDVVPVGFEFDGSQFYVAGLDLTSTRKYKNVTGGNDLVALVIDDLASTTPWTPRFVRVYGKASLTQREGDSAPSLRVTPTVSWSWNLDGQSFPAAANAKPRKSVHDG